MNTTVINEAGYYEALMGIALSFNQDMSKMPPVARGLAHKQGGHNKFLESMVVWVDLTAPRYFWQQFDTYRVGTTKQSESTMHTLLRSELTQDHFEGGISSVILDELEYLRDTKKLTQLKRNLPESFLQRRIVVTNYKVLQNMIHQRKNHKLEEWQWFIEDILKEVEYPEFLVEGS